MKKLIRVGLRTIVTAAAILALSVPAFAATGRIAFSDPSTQVGEEVSVNVKFSTDNGEALGNTDIMLSYDPDMLEYINETDNASGGAGAVRVWTAPDGSSEVATLLRFHALKPGTTNITISSWEAYDNNGSSLESVREGSSAITIAALPTSSGDATLSSLTVAPGTLRPAFSPNTDSYSVTVGLETEQVAVSAVTNNTGATVSLEGGSDLQEGENTVVCRVTAQDGTTTKDYTIIVNRVEGGGETAAGTATQAEPEVLAELTVTARRIRIIDLPEGVEVPEGFRESSIAIGDTKVPGWTWAADESPRYCVFYGMNDNGEQNFYRYDLSEKTIQRYFEGDNIGAVTEEEYNELTDTYNNLVGDYRTSRILMFVFLAIAVILLILLVLSRRSGGSGASSRRGRARSHSSRPTSSSGRSSRSQGTKKLSKEERYMLGEEDEYDEEDYEPSYEAEDLYEPSGSSGESAAPGSSQGSKNSDDDDDFDFFDL